MNENKGKYVWMPLLLALTTAAGIYIGSSLHKEESFDLNSFLSFRPSKIDVILNNIYTTYVDTVDLNNLVEGAIPSIISELDPHSVYIPAKDLEASNEELEGSFSGIGVQFNIQNDTVLVVSVIPGGPSSKVGLLAGDRIVSINDSIFTGKEITNERVMKTLRGKKNTEVTIGIKRNTSKELLSFTITRGDVPITSVETAYLTTDSIGFIKISKFGRTTYDEFMTALAKLTNEGAKSFMIDLRGNSGGYMDIAIEMINEFLPKNSLIVYTEGKSIPRSDAFSNGKGSFQNVPLVILIDEWSASASEIFAGAIQDNDRGTIVGRRSYGKGLVQQQIPLFDGSALRLTIARYFIPSGRSIQKEYALGKGADYEMDLINRFSHGEFYSKDSIKQNDSLVFKTAMGRTVYGGGGIMPDIFIPSDTTGNSSYLNSVINAGLLYQFALNYSDTNRQELLTFKNYESLLQHLNSKNLLEQFIVFADSKGIRRRPVLITISKGVILRHLKAYITRNTMGEDAFYKTFYSDDKTIKAASDIMNEGSAFPQIQESASDSGN